MWEWHLKRSVSRNISAALIVCGATAAIALLLASTQSSFDKDQSAKSLPVLIEATSSDKAQSDKTGAADSALTGFAELARAVKPAVVAVAARAEATLPPGGDMQRFPHGMPDGRRPRFGSSQGSGFFISADGYVVTNDHVVSGNKIVEVRIDSGKSYKAKVVGTDPTSDLALLKVDGRDDFIHANFADSPPNVGDRVIAIGNPFGLGGTVTAGIVSAQGRDVSNPTYEDLIQIDAPVNRGNSGGPTFDVAGHVIGVNSIIFSPTGGSVGIGFAIPSEKAKSVVRQLKEKGVVTRGWMGMQFQSVSEEIADTLEYAKAGGILIADVKAAGPAAAAGLKPGDIVNSMNGEPVRDSHEFNRMLDATPPGAVVVLGVVQDGRAQLTTATVGQAPAPPVRQPQPNGGDAAGDRRDQQLGLQLAPVSGNAGQNEGRGAVVVGIDPVGLAAGHGIDPGDIILDVANQAVESPDDVYRLVANAKDAGKRSVLIRIKSGDTAQFIPLPLG
ncbi:MAG TPA: trypsin-like peptidase domain-containing protein [Xanthobacteraceae bacterium]|nr:trypsin-like peptidase domain-containing protein [Xanthobacteraceae bacterium]